MSRLDLPTLDVRNLHTQARAQAVDLLRASLTQWGFVAVTGHEITPQVLSTAYQETAAFFALPAQTKMRWERVDLGRQRGYTGFGVERAKDHPTGDLKEFFHLGAGLHESDPAVRMGKLPPDIYPDEPQGFIPALRALYAQLDTLAQTLLRAIAEGVGIDPDALSGCIHGGSTVLRAIHYPPVRGDHPTGAVRAAAHEDINLITLLPPSTAPGLELRDRQGQWRAIQTGADVVIVDTGDLMAYWTGGALPSTTHRVVNPPQHTNLSRYSLPFFVHPRPDWPIQPTRGSHPTRTAGDLLRERLIANGVMLATAP